MKPDVLMRPLVQCPDKQFEYWLLSTFDPTVHRLYVRYANSSAPHTAYLADAIADGALDAARRAGARRVEVLTGPSPQERVNTW